MNRNGYERVLLPRRYLLEGEPSKKSAYYAAYLANKFGVLVDAPMKLCEENVASVEKCFGSSVPDSFLKNPQDAKYYSCDELLIEQLVSYIQVELNGARSEDPATFAHVPVFDKVLPDYGKGEERVVRKYYIADKETADRIMAETVTEYCAYTRPWSEDECLDMKTLVDGGFYNGCEISCRDNAATLFIHTGDKSFARLLDHKDVVKLSVKLLGESNPLKIAPEAEAILKVAVNVSKPCPMTKKQAKYFNKLIKKCSADVKRTDNSQSPYAIAKKLVAKGDIVGAAQFLKENGSLLTRSLIWLLSRADDKDAETILAMSGGRNPIAYIQLLLQLSKNSEEARVFKFIKEGRLKVHAETQDECNARKSTIGKELRDKITEVLRDRIRSYYKSCPSLGKIYLSEKFKKVFVPLNTSASGSGIDVLPTGSRLPIRGDFLRTFCYWNDAFDMDLSMVLINDRGEKAVLNWFNESEKPFGLYALMSGDDRGKDGAEYIDLDVEILLERGWKYGVMVINGYYDKLNVGKIYCGYQNKDDLNTEVWAPDNIEMKIHVVGNAAQYIGFAFDFERKEIVILNMLCATDESVVRTSDMKAVEYYLDKNLLETVNMYDLLSLKGETVDDPEKADIVFDDSYEAKDGQEVVRPWDVKKLVSLIK